MQRYLDQIRKEHADVNDGALADARREGKVLLGFNEPDMAGQADMSVAEALELWPRLQSTGLRLAARRWPTAATPRAAGWTGS